MAAAGSCRRCVVQAAVAVVGRHWVGGERCNRAWEGHPGWWGLASGARKRRGLVRNDRRSVAWPGGVVVRRSMAGAVGGPRHMGLGCLL